MRSDRKREGHFKIIFDLADLYSESGDKLVFF